MHTESSLETLSILAQKGDGNIRLKEVAEARDVSKQAISKLLVSLEERGLINRSSTKQGMIIEIRKKGYEVLAENGYVYREPMDVDLEECEACAIDDDKVLQRHHIIPKSEGGPDTEDNIAVLCANCHQRVHALIYNGVEPSDAFERIVRDRKSVDRL